MRSALAGIVAGFLAASLPVGMIIGLDYLRGIDPMLVPFVLFWSVIVAVAIIVGVFVAKAFK